MKGFKYIPILLGACLFTGCSDVDFDAPTRQDGETTFTFYLPGFTTSTRAVADEALNSARVLFYDASNQQIGSEIPLSSFQPGGANNAYKATIPTPPNASYIEVFANLDDDADTDVLNDNLNSRSDVVFYGFGNVDTDTATADVTLVRTCAKTSVTNKVEDFEITNLYLYGEADKGNIKHNGDNINIPEDVDYSETGSSFDEGVPYYHYEAEAGKMYITIYGKYRNVDGWYKAIYVPKDGDSAEENETDIVRNHHYVFEIEGINDYGWATEQEAIEAPADNRMKILLKDYDENIYNMIACRDYYLGVGKNVEVTGKDTSIDVKILTSYTGSPAYKVIIPANSWVKGYTETASVVPSGNNSTVITAAKEYTLKFTFDQNNLSSEPREEIIKIESGDLTRDFRITQGGWDFFNDDPDRRVKIFNLKDHNPSLGYDYFNFIKNELKGAKVSDMGVDRSQALHFAVYPDGDQYYYTIPKLSGDQTPSIKQPSTGYGKFKVEDEDGNWKVSCIDDTNYSMWEGEFVLKNTEKNYEITYKVYHVGLFHKLDSDYLVKGPDGEDTPSGWFYYEQVKIGNIYMLDRNIGASSNKSYHPSGQSIRDNKAARGGYFRISKASNQNNKDESTDFVNKALAKSMPKGYEVPTEATLKTIPLSSFNAREGIIGYAADGGILNQVYLPYAGDMSGTQHTDINHVCIWTQSLLSGYQGFSPSSPEYGFWFRYFDITGTKATFKNTRIGNTISGGNVGEVYKAMPIRCMSQGDGGGSVETGTVVKYRILWTRSGEYKYMRAVNANNTSEVLQDWICTWDNYGYPNNDNSSTRYYGADFETNCQNIRFEFKKADGSAYATSTKASYTPRDLQTEIHGNVGTIIESLTPIGQVTPIPTVEKYRVMWPSEGDHYQVKIKKNNGTTLVDFVTNNGKKNKDDVDYYYYEFETSETLVKFEFQYPGRTVVKPVNDPEYNLSSASEYESMKTVVISALDISQSGEDNTNYRILWPKTDSYKYIWIGTENNSGQIQGWTEGTSRSYNGTDYYTYDITTTNTALWFRFSKNSNGSDAITPKPNAAYTLSGYTTVWDSKRVVTVADLDIPQSGGNTTYKLRGEILSNGWEDIELTQNANGTWYVTGGFSSGNFGFKELDSNGVQSGWYASTNNNNTVYDINGAGTYSCNKDGSNFNLKTAGAYTITFDPSLLQMKIAKNSYKIRVYWKSGDTYDQLNYAVNGSYTKKTQDGIEKPSFDSNNEYRYVDIYIDSNTTITDITVEPCNASGYNTGAKKTGIQSSLKPVVGKTYSYYYKIY